MATTNSYQQLAGDFKQVYKEGGLEDSLPAWAICQDRWKFETGDAIGAGYNVGVILAREAGVSYSASFNTSSPATLNASVAGQVSDALVQSYSIFVRSRIDYAAAGRAAAKGKRAFEKAYSVVLDNMISSARYRLELSLLYGQSGLAIVDANNSGVLTLSSDTFAAAAWAGSVGAVLEAFTGTADSVSQHNGDLTITGVDRVAKTITVTGTNAAVVQNDVLYFKGARTTTGFNEAPGLFKILSNTGSLFGINAANYDTWAAQTHAVNGNLSLTSIMAGASKGLDYGLEKALMLVASSSFATLASNEAALRRYVQDTGQTKRGVKGIKFEMGQVDVEICIHPYLRPSHAFMLNEPSVMRIGSTDITPYIPGSDEEMNVQVTDAAAMELRCMSDQAIFSTEPATCVLFTAISTS